MTRALISAATLSLILAAAPALAQLERDVHQGGSSEGNIAQREKISKAVKDACPDCAQIFDPASGRIYIDPPNTPPWPIPTPNPTQCPPGFELGPQGYCVPKTRSK